MLRLLSVFWLSGKVVDALVPGGKRSVVALPATNQAPGAGDAISGVTGRVGQLVSLLNKLAVDFEAEFKEAQSSYDKQSSANEETIKQAKIEIAANEKRIAELNEAIEKGTADISALKSIVAQLEQDIAAKKKEIEEAIAKRKEEHDEYAKTAEEYNDAISSSHLAYDVLLKAQGAAQTVSNRQGLLQQGSSFSNKRELFGKVNKAVRLLSTLSTVVSPDKVETLQEFLDNATSSEITASTVDKPSQDKAFLQFSGASEQILGILKDMRGEFIAKLQGLQEDEQMNAKNHFEYAERARALVQSMTETKQGRINALNKAKAKKEADSVERSEETDALAANKQLLAETVKASRELAKSWAETSQSHTNEMNGIKKAVDYLEGQQTVGAGKNETSLLQVVSHVAASSQEKPAYESGFKTIKWAIDDMVKTHKTTIAENKEHQETCKATLSGANQVAAQKAAAVAALKAAIADAEASIGESTKKKQEAEKVKLDTENEKKTSQITWEKSDKSRTVEIAQLDESLKLITGARGAIADSGSERMQDVLAILDMIKAECAAEQKNVSSAKLEEQNSWSVEKQQLTDLISSLEEQITTFQREITGYQKEKAELKIKLEKKKGQLPESTDACKNFLAGFQAGQDTLTRKIEDLNSAKAHLESWTEASDSARADYAPDVAYTPEP